MEVKYILCILCVQMRTFLWEESTLPRSKRNCFPPNMDHYFNQQEPINTHYSECRERSDFIISLGAKRVRSLLTARGLSQLQNSARVFLLHILLGTRVLIGTPSGVSKFDFSDYFVSKNSAQIQNFTNW